MSVHHVVGTDPGLVHTGVVHLEIDTLSKKVTVSHTAIAGPDVLAAQAWIAQDVPVPPAQCHLFIEGYRPRSNFGPDGQMVAAIAEFRRVLGGKVLLNHGVLKVVRRPLLELLGCWSFSTPTNHQDLRSAARIAVLGMLKDDQLNTIVSDIVRDRAQWEAVAA